MKNYLMIISFLFSSASSAKTITTNPGAPDLFEAMAVNSNRVELSWVDNSINETHFLVISEPDDCYDDPDYGIDGACASEKKKYTVPANSTTYIDTQALANIGMRYELYACKQNDCTEAVYTYVRPPRGHHSVSGKVVDSDFNPISGAVVKLGMFHQTTTDEHGVYSFNDILTGTYDIRAEKENYKFERRYSTIRKNAVRQHFIAQ